MKLILSLIGILIYTVSSDGYDTDTDSADDTTIEGPYKMGVLITCMEQNDESPIGYRDPIYYLDDSAMCTNNSTKKYCDRYKDTAYPYPGRGDVCDHQDPRTGITRNACYFNTIFGPEENEEKTWSYKCWEISQCPLKYPNGTGRSGCKVSRKRINCCCQEDYCNGNDLIIKFAQWGRADKYPPDYQEICDYDYGDTYVYWNEADFENTEFANCTYDPDKQNDDQDEISTTEQGEEESEESEESQESESGEYGYGEDTAEEQYSSGHVGYNAHFSSNGAKPSNEVINVADIVLIFSYFILGIVCLGVGVFIGTKWKANVMQQQMIMKSQQLDI